jgi:hypothetical protein
MHVHIGEAAMMFRQSRLHIAGGVDWPLFLRLGRFAEFLLALV